LPSGEELHDFADSLLKQSLREKEKKADKAPKNAKKATV
jgi:hypothetical protein